MCKILHQNYVEPENPITFNLVEGFYVKNCPVFDSADPELQNKIDALPAGTVFKIVGYKILREDNPLFESRIHGKTKTFRRGRF